MNKLTALMVCVLVAAPASAASGGYLAPGTYGVGAHVHRFVLRDPATGAPMPRARYRLYMLDQSIAGVDKGVLMGVSDRLGRTAAVRFPERIPRSAWTLIPVAGHGQFGDAMVLKDADDVPLRRHPYVLDVAGSYLFCGLTGDDGGTYYVRSRRIRTVSLYLAPEGLSVTELAWCRRSADVIGKLPANAGPALVFRQLLGNVVASQAELGSDMQDRMRRKLIHLAIEARNRNQYDTVLTLGPDYDRAEMGRDLIEADWMVERGMAYIELELAKAPEDPDLLASKGWGLFRLGQRAQALDFLGRAIALYGAGTEDNVKERSTALIHQGEVLWMLGRFDGARAAFAGARELKAEGTALADTMARLQVLEP